MMRKLRKLQKPQLRKTVLSADLRERSAESAEYAANAANSEGEFVVSVSNRQRLKPLPELKKGAKAHRPDELAAVAAAAAVDCHKCCNC
ncbi:MAG: hypothetical protein H0X30_35350 [Anaerolineae bacterium]|nr:hypothetical protein [Anaerolineae bacterium]